MSALAFASDSPASVFPASNPIANTALAKAKAATASTTGTGSTTSSSSSSSSSVDSISATFYNLLVKELQNQDPTAPLDSTAMVGQIISLNQLQQLASINQDLTPSSSSTSSSTSPSKGVAGAVDTSSATVAAARNALLTNLSDPSTAASVNNPAADQNQPLNLSAFNLAQGVK